MADLLFYKVAIQLKWSDLTRWNYNNETRRHAHPDVISGLHRELDEGYWTGGASKGCIGNWMNGTGLGELVSVAYRGISLAKSY